LVNFCYFPKKRFEFQYVTGIANIIIVTTIFIAQCIEFGFLDKQDIEKKIFKSSLFSLINIHLRFPYAFCGLIVLFCFVCEGFCCMDVPKFVCTCATKGHLDCFQILIISIKLIYTFRYKCYVTKFLTHLDKY
jgi:hypothetical protein